MDKTFEILLVILFFFFVFTLFLVLLILNTRTCYDTFILKSVCFFLVHCVRNDTKNYSLWNIILCTINVFLTCKGNGHKSCLLQMHQALNAYHTPNGRTHRASNSFCSYLHRLHKISLCEVNTSKQISIKGVYSASK